MRYMELSKMLPEQRKLMTGAEMLKYNSKLYKRLHKLNSDIEEEMTASQEPFEIGWFGVGFCMAFGFVFGGILSCIIGNLVKFAIIQGIISGIASSIIDFIVQYFHHRSKRSEATDKVYQLGIERVEISNMIDFVENLSDYYAARELFSDIDGFTEAQISKIYNLIATDNITAKEAILRIIPASEDLETT